MTGQRQQAISLVLSKAKINGSILAEALKVYDLNRLSTNLCELIIPILPNESEISGVKSFENPSHLADADKFIFALVDVPGFELRMKSIVFKNTYKENIQEFHLKTEKVMKILNLFKNDERVLEWLKIVLAYGNYLNGTSNRLFLH